MTSTQCDDLEDFQHCIPEDCPSRMEAASALQGHCCGCGVLLLFTQGGVVVECARCNAITAQGRCSGCSITLMFPPGSSAVECAICGAVTDMGDQSQAVEIGKAYLQCAGCSMELMYPREADSVKCSLCHHITSTSAPPCENKNIIVVKNPDADAPDAYSVGYVVGSREAQAAQKATLDEINVHAAHAAADPEARAQTAALQTDGATAERRATAAQPSGLPAEGPWGGGLAVSDARSFLRGGVLSWGAAPVASLSSRSREGAPEGQRSGRGDGGMRVPVHADTGIATVVLEGVTVLPVESPAVH